MKKNPVLKICPWETTNNTYFKITTYNLTIVFKAWKMAYEWEEHLEKALCCFWYSQSKHNTSKNQPDSRNEQVF